MRLFALWMVFVFPMCVCVSLFPCFFMNVGDLSCKCVCVFMNVVGLSCMCLCLSVCVCVCVFMNVGGLSCLCVCVCVCVCVCLLFVSAFILECMVHGVQ